ncbi:MAG: sulfotransferase family protein [Vicinamibacterales bacterium]
MIILGVSRSGTTLLKQMLDHHSEVAIPRESFFLPQLWARYRRRPDTDALLADLECLPRIRDWGVSLEEVRRRVPPGASFTETIATVYRVYADSCGKPRYGEKTPQYLQHLELLERVFPGAQYVHIVRDGRNAALSYAETHRRRRLDLTFPQGLGDFAACWRREVLDARTFGASAASGRYFELRYEDLIAQPEARLREVCAFLDLRFEPMMLEYHADFQSVWHPDHKRLGEPPSQGERAWRTQMPSAALERFEAIAGDALAAFGYERAHPAPSAVARARGAIGAVVSRGRVVTMGAVMPIFYRSRLWRVRQRYLLRTRRTSRVESQSQASGAAGRAGH